MFKFLNEKKNILIYFWVTFYHRFPKKKKNNKNWISYKIKILPIRCQKLTSGIQEVFFYVNSIEIR